MKVSVIIPARNEEKYIYRCLVSLKNQSEAPDEIILVDNNSTDNTVKIAKNFNIIITHEKKPSLILARNKGFNLAKYQLIARCDADTILPPDWIIKIKKNFLENIDALSGPVIFYDLPFRSTFYFMTYFKIMKHLLGGQGALIGPQMILKKALWKKIQNKICLDDTLVHEDLDLTIHALKEGAKIKIDRALVIKGSGRRIKNNPYSFFIEYPLRAIKTLKSHHLI